jgi:hypothetical protein
LFSIHPSVLPPIFNIFTTHRFTSTVQLPLLLLGVPDSERDQILILQVITRDGVPVRQHDVPIRDTNLGRRQVDPRVLQNPLS